jgi:hypothetical protein
MRSCATSWRIWSLKRCRALSRDLAGPEARNAGGLAVVLGHAVDLGVDDRAGDFDHQLLARVRDVDELGLHGMSEIA